MQSTRVLLGLCVTDPTVFETNTVCSLPYFHEIANENPISHGQKDLKETFKCMSVLQKQILTAFPITE